MSTQTASIIAAVVASAPAWAMFASQRAANRRHGQRLTDLHAKVDQLSGASATSQDGESP